MAMLVVILFATLVLAGIGLALGAYSKRASLPGDGLPRCGRCAYVVRGVGSFECPECGADLREAGINTGQTRSVLPAGCGTTFGWTVLVLIIAGILAGPYMGLIPRHRQIDWELAFGLKSEQVHSIDLDATFIQTFHRSDWDDYHYTSSFGSYSTHFRGARHDYFDMDTLDPDTRLATVSILIRPNPTGTSMSLPGRLVIDATDDSFVWYDPGGTELTAEGLSEQDILDSLRDCGADTNDPAVQLEAQELFAIYERMKRGQSNYHLSQLFVAKTGSREESLEEGGLARPLYGLGWLAVWVFGLRRLARRGRQKAEPGPEPTPEQISKKY